MKVLWLMWCLWWMPKTDPVKPALVVRFEGVRYPNGYVFVGLYENQESWKKRVPSKEINFEKWTMKDGCLTGTLTDLKPGGKYGLAVLDDANGNNVVDMGLVFPLEGFGFSNFEVRGIMLPKFEDFAFTYPTPDTVVVKMRYLDF
ncbi:DUF2141 domain-containing protein [Marinoscillum sp.]|uniref:DUF2141 domain-containing protein n=1 Tax=Marinoscillum sp. TaxID=2024838 RepID=UPI003BAC2BCE